MKYERKKEIADQLFEEDDRITRRTEPRIFRPLPDPKMVEAWEPIAPWKYKNNSDDI